MLCTYDSLGCIYQLVSEGCNICHCRGEVKVESNWMCVAGVVCGPVGERGKQWRKGLIMMTQCGECAGIHHPHNPILICLQRICAQWSMLHQYLRSAIWCSEGFQLSFKSPTCLRLVLKLVAYLKKSYQHVLKISVWIEAELPARKQMSWHGGHQLNAAVKITASC